MGTARKITVDVPPELLEKAQRASGSGITQTVRTGLELVAASQTDARLRQLRGNVRFTRTSSELKADRAQSALSALRADVELTRPRGESDRRVRWQEKTRSPGWTTRGRTRRKFSPARARTGSTRCCAPSNKR